jgi:hypothetical protein
MQSYFSGNFILALIALSLLVFINYYINFLAQNDFVACDQCKEAFTSGNTQSVDMPLNVTYSCSNFCAPGTARCAITGQQCFSDLDCPGCQPKINSQSTFTPKVPAANDSGKLTTGTPLTYSPLTYGYGTRDFSQVSNKKPAQASWGKNTWRDQFDAENKMYQDRYSLPGEIKYRKTETTTGLFDLVGPLPSNFVESSPSSSDYLYKS